MKPPNIEVISPAFGSSITGSEVEIILRATDLGGSGFDGRSLKYRYQSNEVWTDWREIGEQVEGEEAILKRNFSLPFGMIYLQFKGSDILGNTHTTPNFLISMKAPLINRKPIPKIASPLNNTLFEYGQPVHLNSDGTSDDGVGEFDRLRYTWISNIDGVIGTVYHV